MQFSNVTETSQLNVFIALHHIQVNLSNKNWKWSSRTVDSR